VDGIDIGGKRTAAMRFEDNNQYATSTTTRRQQQQPV